MDSLLTEDQKKEFAALWARLEARDLKGGTVEVFHDCSFDAMSHLHVRSIIISATWKNGRPDIIRSINPLVFTNTGENPIVWKEMEGEIPRKSLFLSYSSAKIEPETTNVLPELLDIITESQGRFDISWPNGLLLSIYPKDVNVPDTPANYQSKRHVETFNQLMTGQKPSEDEPHV